MDTPKLCECGCGLPVPIATRNRPERGWVKGQPKRFIDRHHYGHVKQKVKGVDYIIEDRGYVTECWIWQRTIYRGYGRMGNRKRAHRVYYERAYGSIPPNTEIDHRCQVKCCVNPDHLEAVTHAENMRRAGPKLTRQTARQVRELRLTTNLTRVEIGKQFGISDTMVGTIAHGKQWYDDP